MLKPYEGWLLATDIDGTIKPFDKPIPQNNIDAMHRFIELGGTFTLVTGRSVGAALPAVRDLGLRGPMLINNGSTAYDYGTEKVLFSTDLPEEVYGIIGDWLTRFPTVGIEVYHDRDLAILRRTDITDKRLRRFDINAMRYHYETLDTCEKPWQKALACAPKEVSDEVERYARDTIPENILFMRTSDEYCELVPTGASKGDGVRRLAKLLGFPPDRIITAGDYHNDVDLLKAGALSFAPADALPVAKEAATHLTVPCEEGILPHVLAVLDGIR